MKNRTNMLTKMRLWLYIAFLSAGLLIGRPYPAQGREAVAFTGQDRLLILAPHPDDEVLGCAGIIQEAVKRKIPVKIVFLTYGDNNQWSFMVYRKHPVLMPGASRSMGLVRHDEAIAAAKVLGVPEENLVFLGYPDYRTLEIWYAHWGDRKPAESMFTRVKAVPYKNAFRPGALYKGEEIVADLENILRDFKPTKVFCSHPGDHNPDHQSLYLFTRIALWNLSSSLQPQVLPYLIHFKHWPLPRGYHPEKSLVLPDLFKDKIDRQELVLTQPEIECKFAAIQKHRSQYNSSAKYLKTFMRANELFGDFPPVTLRPKDSDTYLSVHRVKGFADIPEELTTEERISFVGIEEDRLYLEGEALVLAIKLSRPLGEEVGVSLYVFGYRDDTSFAAMPKLRIRFGALKHAIYDQDRNLPLSAVSVDRKPKEIMIRVPLALLGNPRKVLTSARTYSGAVPLDWVMWRTLEIADDAAPSKK